MNNIIVQINFNYFVSITYKQFKTSEREREREREREW